MNDGVFGSGQAMVRWAAGIVILVWVTAGDLVLCLFAALRHSAAYDPNVASRFAAALVFCFIVFLNRERHDALGVPLFFLGLVVSFFATYPVVRSYSFQSGVHEIAVRNTALLIPMVLAKAVCWVYIFLYLKAGRRPDQTRA